MEVLSRWKAFVESDTGLQFGRLCQFYGQWPGHLLLDDNDEPLDMFEQIALAEALMLRVQVRDVEDAKRQQEEAERQAKIQEGRNAPAGTGAQRAVRPPTAEEIMAGMTEGKR